MTAALAAEAPHDETAAAAAEPSAPPLPPSHAHVLAMAVPTEFAVERNPPPPSRWSCLPCCRSPSHAYFSARLPVELEGVIGAQAYLRSISRCNAVVHWATRKQLFRYWIAAAIQALCCLFIFGPLLRSPLSAVGGAC